MDFVLDQATRVDARGDGVFRAAPDARFWNQDHAFGGWLAAAFVSAWQAHPERRASLVNQNVQFHAPVRGQAIDITVGLVERRRTLDFWKLEARDPQAPGDVLAASTIVAGQREPTTTQFQAPAEPVRPQPDCFRLPAGEHTPSWFGHYELYLAHGRPFQKNDEPRSVTWVRESDLRPLDTKSLVAMVDTPMPRTFFVGDARTPASTVSLSTHVYATDREIEAVADRFVCLETRSKSIRHSLLNAETYAWTEEGLLLAASYQTGLFRERGG